MDKSNSKLKNFMFSKQGEHRIKILEDNLGKTSYGYFVHWLMTDKYGDRRHRPIMHKVEDKDTCEVCKIDRPRMRYDLIVREEGEIKILSCGIALMRQITEGLTRFDTREFMVAVTGEGLRRQYRCYPDRSKTEDERYDINLEDTRFPISEGKEKKVKRKNSRYQYITSRL